MIEPAASFNDNLQQLPPIDALDRVDLIDGTGTTIASIENQTGKRGSLAVYAYLGEQFGALNVAAAEYGLTLFAEHTPDARSRPGAHPNIDRLLDIAAGGDPLSIKLVPAC